VIGVTLLQILDVRPLLLYPANQIAELLFHHRDDGDADYHLDKQTQPKLL
jgi:hypothetical protein